MAVDDGAPQPDKVLGAAEDSVEAELARALSTAHRRIHWLQEERDRLQSALPGEPGGPERGDGSLGEAVDPGGDADMLAAVAAHAVPVAARRLAMGEAASSDTWERLTQHVRETYLARARAAVEAAAPVFEAALAAIPGLGEVRRAQHRMGLPPESGLTELLDHVRAQGRAHALQEVAEDLRERLTDHETAREAVQAVELVLAEGERMAAEHTSPVAVEVAEWFAGRLRRALAAPDVTLGDALEAEREQVLLAVAAELGLEGMDALAWYSQMSTRLDAADGEPGA